MEKIIKRVLKILSTVMVVIVIVLAVLLAGVRLVGLTPYTVLSGSMEPTYHVGSVIYVKDVDPTELKQGDPLTFRMESGTIVTHRIIEVLNSGTSELSFRTKGDANEVADGVSPATAVVGKPVFSIPYLGFISSVVQTPKGLILVVSCTVIIFVMSFLVDAIFTKEKISESETANADSENNNG